MSVKGVHFLDVESARQYQLHLNLITKVAEEYKFQQLIPPVIAEQELFTRTIQASSIVQKEMFTLNSQSKETLVLRPEGTALVAAYLLRQGKLRHQEPQRYWYAGPMFRYERPQKGRFRQFYQVGLESFCVSPLLQELEMLTLTWQVMEAALLKQCVTLEINSLGTPEECKAYTESLIAYLHTCDLTPVQKQTLAQNPLRCLDTKDPRLLQQLAQAPKITDYVDQTQLTRLVSILKELHIPVVINPLLVRGLDYYCHTVFEWKLQGEALGAQNTICAGGRYDSIFNGLGGTVPVHAMGCAFGMERLCSSSKQLSPRQYLHTYLFAYAEEDLIPAFLIQREERWVHLEDKLLSYASHLKRSRPYKRTVYMRSGQLYDAFTQRSIKHLREVL